MAIKSEVSRGGGEKGLNGPAIMKKTFFAASRTYIYLSFKNSWDSRNRAARLLENFVTNNFTNNF